MSEVVSHFLLTSSFPLTSFETSSMSLSEVSLFRSLMDSLEEDLRKLAADESSDEYRYFLLQQQQPSSASPFVSALPAESVLTLHNSATPSQIVDPESEEERKKQRRRPPPASRRGVGSRILLSPAIETDAPFEEFIQGRPSSYILSETKKQQLERLSKKQLFDGVQALLFHIENRNKIILEYRSQVNNLKIQNHRLSIGSGSQSQPEKQQQQHKSSSNLPIRPYPPESNSRSASASASASPSASASASSSASVSAFTSTPSPLIIPSYDPTEIEAEAAAMISSVLTISESASVPSSSLPSSPLLPLSPSSKKSSGPSVQPQSPTVQKWAAAKTNPTLPRMESFLLSDGEIQDALDRFIMEATSQLNTSAIESDDDNEYDESYDEESKKFEVPKTISKVTVMSNEELGVSQTPPHSFCTFPTSPSPPPPLLLENIQMIRPIPGFDLEGGSTSTLDPLLCKDFASSHLSHYQSKSFVLIHDL